MTDPKTRVVNFKTDAVQEALIDERSAQLGLSRSEYLRKCEAFSSEFFMCAPALIKGNRSDYRKLAEDKGKTLVRRMGTLMFGVL